MKTSTTTKRRSRRLILASASALVSLITLSACGSDTTPASADAETGSATSASDQVTDITVGSTPSLSGLGLRVALEQGEFESRGLTVEAVPNKSANAAVPALLNGEIQVAQMDTLTFMLAHSQGLPIKIIAGMGQQATNGDAGEMSAASVVSKPNSGINGPADLVGKKVAVPAIKTQTWMNIRALVDEAGGDSTQVEFVEVPPAQMLDLLAQGAVDAATPSEPAASGAIGSGAVELVTNTDGPGNKGVATSVYAATEEFIAANPDTISAFADALYAAAKSYNADRELGIEAAINQLELKPEQLQNAFIQPSFEEPVTAEQIDRVAKLAVKYEILSSAPNADDLLHNS